MNFLSIEISIASFLPALILCGYVYYNDRIEKEPVGLLALLFAAGALVAVPSMYIERILTGVADGFFEKYITFLPDGTTVFSSNTAFVIHKFVFSFLIIALSEVVLKWLVLFLITSKNKNFNYIFDGIVYSVFVSLGYALTDNVRYIVVNGWDISVLRLLSSVPCHLFIGIIMGYFYTMWHVHYKAQKKEAELIEKAVIKDRKIKFVGLKLASSLLIPFAVDGAYRLASSMDTRTVNIIFYFVVFTLYGFGFIVINGMSSRDTSSDKYSTVLLKKLHPDAVLLSTENEKAEKTEDSTDA